MRATEYACGNEPKHGDLVEVANYCSGEFAPVVGAQIRIYRDEEHPFTCYTTADCLPSRGWSCHRFKLVSRADGTKESVTYIVRREGGSGYGQRDSQADAEALAQEVAAQFTSSTVVIIKAVTTETVVKKFKASVVVSEVV